MKNLNIAILCAARKSVYHTLEGVDVYDDTKDARTFVGTGPVICHAPCRGYSAYMSHWAKPERGEKDLALYCFERVVRNGGVFEHPAHSRFITKWIGIYPNEIRGGIKCIEIHQSWFGYPTTKRTWLLMPSAYELPEIPFSLTQYGKEKSIFENMSHFQRHETTKMFASWLIQLVRMNHEI